MRSTEEWRERARRDPLHAVASHAGTEGNRWDEDAFYALGRSDWADFEFHWSQYLGTSLAGRCLEIGCGAGRITAPLTSVFDDVVALDVSADMIALAEVRASADYHAVTDTRMPVGSNEVDGVFTCHVLQHFERIAEVRQALVESFRVLKPGGSIMAHLLIASGQRHPLTFAVDWAKHQLALRLRKGHGATVARRYHADVVRAWFEQAGFEQVQLREFAVRSNGGPHTFWFGTKPER